MFFFAEKTKIICFGKTSHQFFSSFGWMLYLVAIAIHKTIIIIPFQSGYEGTESPNKRLV